MGRQPFTQWQLPGLAQPQAQRQSFAQRLLRSRSLRGPLRALTWPGCQIRPSGDLFKRPSLDVAERWFACLMARVERAVLALILLRTVAIPRAQGLHQHDGWAGGEHSVTLEELVRNRHLSRAAITGALRGLRAVGYVAMTASGGYIPGPALARLSAVGREALWEDLLLLARPHGYMAERIRVRRNETRALLSQPLADTVGGRG